MYRAEKLSDLDKVYAQVVRDLSTVYSIGTGHPTRRWTVSGVRWKCD